MSTTRVAASRSLRKERSVSGKSAGSGDTDTTGPQQNERHHLLTSRAFGSSGSTRTSKAKRKAGSGRCRCRASSPRRAVGTISSAMRRTTRPCYLESSARSTSPRERARSRQAASAQGSAVLHDKPLEVRTKLRALRRAFHHQGLPPKGPTAVVGVFRFGGTSTRGSTGNRSPATSEQCYLGRIAFGLLEPALLPHDPLNTG